MATHYLFADEAGDFAFTRTGRASRYFMLCSVTTENTGIGQDLLRLRRRILMEGHLRPDEDLRYFHAAQDPKPRRDRVFEIIEGSSLRADVTVFEKSKAQPHVRAEEELFYKYAWFYHLKHVLRQVMVRGDRIFITGASLGTARTRATFKTAINEVAQQLLGREEWKVAFLKSSEDPCLWAADYVAWAVQRKWERDKREDYDRIAHLLTSEFDVWKHGQTHYY